MLTSARSKTARQEARRSQSGVAIAASALALLWCAGAVADPEAPSPAPDAAAISAPSFTGNPELKARLDDEASLVVAGERLHAKLLRPFYAAHDDKTVWDAHPAQVEALWSAVLRAGENGLDPALFHAGARERAASLSPVERDLLFSDAFLSYADALARGAMPVEERYQEEDLSPAAIDIPAALDRAIADPDPAGVIAGLAPTSPDYLAMRRAYDESRSDAASAAIVVPRTALGASKGRRPTTDPHALAEHHMHELAIALERLRWLPRVMPAERIMVNTAIQQLRLYHDNEVVFTTRVVAGQPDKQTPEFATDVTSVLFNPPWYVPRSILEKEILPKLAEDPDYLTSHHMRYRTANSIEQLPGPDAALGQLKFEMADRFDVYLHDTPQKSFFARASRLLSHGCVRVENPRQLASLLLQEEPPAIAKAIGVGYTHRQTLAAPVPVFVVYQTAYVDSDGSIQFRSDPYQRDDEIWQWLNRSPQAPVAQEAVAAQRKG